MKILEKNIPHQVATEHLFFGLILLLINIVGDWTSSTEPSKCTVEFSQG